MKNLFFIIAVLINVSVIHGYTVSELIELSLLYSPETQATAQNWIRARSGLGVVESDLYPKLSVAASVSHGRDYSFINGPMTNYTLFRGELVLDYLLFNFGKLDHSIQASRDLVAASLWSHDFSVQQVMIKTLRAYFHVLKADVNLKADQASLKQTEDLLQGTKELANAGRKNNNDVLALEVRKNDFLIRVKEKEAEFLAAMSYLNSLIGKPLNDPIALAPLPDIPSAVPLLETSRYLRSDLLAKYKTVEAKRQQLAATKSAALPSVRFTGKSGAERYTRSRSEGFDYNVAVRLAYPIFDGYENCYKQQQEIADISTEIWRIIDLERDIDNEIATLQLKLEAAWSVYQIAEKGEATTEEMFKGANELYRAGKYSIFDVLNAQQTYYANMIKNELAKVDYFRALNELAYALGNLENLWEK